MHQYAVKTRFSFSGTFFVVAQSKEEAKEFVEKHCGMVNIGGIHSTLPCEDVDWDFPIHPDKIVDRVKASRIQEKAYE